MLKDVGVLLTGEVDDENINVIVGREVDVEEAELDEVEEVEVGEGDVGEEGVVEEVGKLEVGVEVVEVLDALSCCAASEQCKVDLRAGRC